MSMLSRRLPAPSPIAFSQTAGTRGFSFLELVTVIAIIGILLAVAISRLLPYIDEAERIGVLTLEGQIRSMLMLAAAKRIANGESASISRLNGSNPMSLMLETPHNYVGELSGDETTSVPRRNWYFDVETRRLVYRKGRSFGPIGDRDSLDDPEFKVQVAFDDRDGNRIFDPGRDELFGVRLQRAAGAEWLAGTERARQ